MYNLEFGYYPEVVFVAAVKSPNSTTDEPKRPRHQNILKEKEVIQSKRLTFSQGIGREDGSSEFNPGELENALSKSMTKGKSRNAE
jgi:hypothetical protein